MNHLKCRITPNVNVFTKIDRFRRNLEVRCVFRMHYRGQRRHEDRENNAIVHCITRRLLTKEVAVVSVARADRSVSDVSKGKKDSRSATKGFNSLCMFFV